MTGARDGARWILLGFAGWTTVALLWVLANGLQRLSRGAPFLESVQDLSSTLVVVSVLAALSPLVFLALRRVGDGPLAFRVLLYFVIGAAYWVASAAVQTGLAEVGFIQGASGCGTTFGALLFRCGFRVHILFAAMVMLYETGRYMRELQRREVGTAQLRAELARARTAALRAELHPHFLFNTLHVASGLMNRDVGAARKVLDDLSELLRQSISRNGAPLVPLGDEIQLVHRYLEIQKARFGDRLAARFHIADDTLGALVPSLLLQPLVENAIQHGIGNQQEGGRIEIAVDREDGHLRLRVSDNGVGLAPGEHSPAREGIGVGSTRTRLRLLYGDRASIRFFRPPDGGCAVEVNIPETLQAGASHG